MFPADISKNDKISRWRPIDENLHGCFSATRRVQNKSFLFLTVTIPAFCIYAQNTVRPCSCGDQAVTHTHTHTAQKTTITLRLCARVNNIPLKLTAITHCTTNRSHSTTSVTIILRLLTDFNLSHENP